MCPSRHEVATSTQILLESLMASHHGDSQSSRYLAVGVLDYTLVVMTAKS
jgi:hypothetical protein